MQLVIEPELRTNQPRKKLLHSEPPEERVYEPQGVGMMLKKGDEVRDMHKLCLLELGCLTIILFQQV